MRDLNCRIVITRTRGTLTTLRCHNQSSRVSVVSYRQTKSGNGTVLHATMVSLNPTKPKTLDPKPSTLDSSLDPKPSLELDATDSKRASRAYGLKTVTSRYQGKSCEARRRSERIDLKRSGAAVLTV